MTPADRLRSSADGFGAPDRTLPRMWPLSAVLILHAALLLLLLAGGSDTRSRGIGPDTGAAEVYAFALTVPYEPSERQAGEGAGQLRAEDGLAEPMDADVAKGRGIGDGGFDGDALMGDELALALADDPLAGGGAPGYEAVLRRHIAHHRQQPDMSGGRLRTGVVIVRFRVDRDGRVVDARVLQTQGPSLDEAALAALWRAEPLPGVPAGMPAPLEVDVPIDFRLRG